MLLLSSVTLATNVPGLCVRWGFLLLIFTNIPKRLNEKNEIKEENTNTKTLPIILKPHLHKTLVSGSLFFLYSFRLSNLT